MKCHSKSTWSWLSAANGKRVVCWSLIAWSIQKNDPRSPLVS